MKHPYNASTCVNSQNENMSTFNSDGQGDRLKVNVSSDQAAVNLTDQLNSGLSMNSTYSENRGINRVGIDFINKYNNADEPELLSKKENFINQSHIRHGNYHVGLPYFDQN